MSYSRPRGQGSRRGIIECTLTVKLTGRPEASDQRRGRTLSSRARGAQPQAHHGPLQRLLGPDTKRYYQLLLLNDHRFQD